MKQKLRLGSAIGRPGIEAKYSNVHDYLNQYVLKIKDHVIELRKEEFKQRKAWNAAVAKLRFASQRLDRAYEGFEKFRK